MLRVYVQPRASRTRVVGLHGEYLKIQRAAPPVDGEANAALVAFLADALSVPKARVQMVAGDAGRRKRLFLAGVDLAAVQQMAKLRRP